MPRHPKLSPKTESHIGRILIQARDAGTPWKVLIARYRLSRSKLWQLYQAAAVRNGKNVYKHREPGQRRADAA